MCDLLAAALWKRAQDNVVDLALAACIEVESELLYLHPIGHSDRMTRAYNLSISLRKHFDCTGSRESINEEIRILRSMMAFDLPDIDRARLCFNLASSLEALFNVSEDTELLDEAIRLKRQSLDLTPHGIEERALPCAGLAKSLKLCFRWKHEVTLLEEAARLGREALSLLAPHSPQRLMVYLNLSDSLHRLHEHSGGSALMDEGIRLARTALSTCPPRHLRRADSCEELAIWLGTYFKQTGDIASLDEAIGLQREVLELEQTRHPDRAYPNLAYPNLAHSLALRFRHSADAASLDESIVLYRRYLDLCPPGHTQRYLACKGLAESLYSRLTQTGNSAALDQIISLQREAFALCPVGDQYRASVCSGLAISLRMRFQQTRDYELIDEAIRLHREGLRLQPVGHPDRAETCVNLGTQLRTRFRGLQDIALLDESIQLHREGLSMLPSDHPTRTPLLQNLATLLATHYQYTKQRPLLDEALKLQKEGLDATPVNHPRRASSCVNLAITLRHWDTREDVPALIRTLSQLLEEAHLLYSPSHPDRWRCEIELAWLALLQGRFESALEYLTSALGSPGHNALGLLDSATRIISQILSQPPGLPYAQAKSLLDAYSKVLDLVSLTAGLTFDRSTQLRHITAWSSIGPSAFALASCMRKLSTGLELLERARGRIWSQTLHLRQPQLEDVPAELAMKLQQLIECMTSVNRTEDVQGLMPTSTFLPHRDVVHEQHNRLQQVLHDIRSVPGLHDFMRGPSYQALATTANRSPVVVLLAEKTMCHALVIASADKPIIDMQFQGLDISQLQLLDVSKLGSRSRGSFADDQDDDSERGIGISKKKPKPQLSTQLSMQLAVLWIAVVKPIITYLGFTVSLQYYLTAEFKYANKLCQKGQAGRQPRIHWCPTGAFTSIPIHAAGIYEGQIQECCSDYAVSSYTPTLTALLRAQQGASTYTADQVKLITISAVHAQSLDLPSLPYAAEEVEGVAKVVSTAGAFVQHTSGTTSNADLLASLQSSNFLHIASHGIQDIDEPHESHFCLSHGRLTVSELMNVDLKTSFFAFLSACQTAQGSQEHAEEAIHLAASMLFAGFRSVVATMW
jgi:tetratricopeptide (TPR) repeat protein